MSGFEPHHRPLPGDSDTGHASGGTTVVTREGGRPRATDAGAPDLREWLSGLEFPCGWLVAAKNLVTDV